MIDMLRSDAEPEALALGEGLHLFADGCYEPVSGRGGWAFVVHRDAVEIAFDCGGMKNTANNRMEAMALLQAARWLGDNAGGEPATIWSDSVYAVKGCNSLLPIWKRNGWKKLEPNPKVRRRTIADADVWHAIDLQLSQNPAIVIAWCKGHAGIGGNERADALADQGRLSIDSIVRPA